jgi:ABC-type transport system involved in cytochrome c biogenesis permease subunit
MGFASISPSVERGIQPLVPALKSNWLHIHVITCFMAYAAFAISFICSVLYLVGRKWETLPLKMLEEINYKSIIIGFPMLTSGILTGAVWAQYAWGSYWRWDPKETWSLITWIVYALFLHVRQTRNWKGKTAAIVSVLGFLSVIFNYFVVNFVLSGLHSYAT